MAGASNTGGPDPTIAAFRIIHFALIMGVVILAVVAGVLGPEMASNGEEGRDGSMDMLAYVAIAMLVTSVPMAVQLRTVLARGVAARRDEALEQVAAGVMPKEVATASLVSAAMIEGAGLFGGVVALITGMAWVLAVPIAAVVVMVLLVPSESGVRSLVESV